MAEGLKNFKDLNIELPSNSGGDNSSKSSGQMSKQERRAYKKAGKFDVARVGVDKLDFEEIEEKLITRKLTDAEKARYKKTRITYKPKEKVEEKDYFPIPKDILKRSEDLLKTYADTILKKSVEKLKKQINKTELAKKKKELENEFKNRPDITPHEEKSEDKIKKLLNESISELKIELDKKLTLDKFPEHNAHFLDQAKQAIFMKKRRKLIEAFKIELEKNAYKEPLAFLELEAESLKNQKNKHAPEEQKLSDSSRDRSGHLHSGISNPIPVTYIPEAQMSDILMTSMTNESKANTAEKNEQALSGAEVVELQNALFNELDYWSKKLNEKPVDERTPLDKFDLKNFNKDQYGWIRNKNSKRLHKLNGELVIELQKEEPDQEKVRRLNRDILINNRIFQNFKKASEENIPLKLGEGSQVSIGDKKIKAKTDSEPKAVSEKEAKFGRIVKGDIVRVRMDKNTENVTRYQIKSIGNGKVVYQNLQDLKIKPITLSIEKMKKFLFADNVEFKIKREDPEPKDEKVGPIKETKESKRLKEVMKLEETLDMRLNPLIIAWDLKVSKEEAEDLFKEYNKLTKRELPKVSEQETALPREKAESLIKALTSLRESQEQLEYLKERKQQLEKIANKEEKAPDDTSSRNKKVLDNLFGKEENDEKENILKDVKSVAKVLEDFLNDEYSGFKHITEKIAEMSKQKKGILTAKSVAEEYSAAKLDGSNPEFVKAVEEIVSIELEIHEFIYSKYETHRTQLPKGEMAQSFDEEMMESLQKMYSKDIEKIKEKYAKGIVGSEVKSDTKTEAKTRSVERIRLGMLKLEINENIELLLMKDKIRMPKLEKFDLIATPNGFLIKSTIKVKMGKPGDLFRPSISFDFNLPLENQNGELALGEEYIDAGIGMATNKVKKELAPLIPEILPGIKSYFEQKHKKQVESMKIENGELVLNLIG